LIAIGFVCALLFTPKPDRQGYHVKFHSDCDPNAGFPLVASTADGPWGSICVQNKTEDEINKIARVICLSLGRTEKFTDNSIGKKEPLPPALNTIPVFLEPNCVENVDNLIRCDKFGLGVGLSASCYKNTKMSLRVTCDRYVKPTYTKQVSGFNFTLHSLRKTWYAIHTDNPCIASDGRSGANYLACLDTKEKRDAATELIKEVEEDLKASEREEELKVWVGLFSRQHVLDGSTWKWGYNGKKAEVGEWWVEGQPDGKTSGGSEIRGGRAGVINSKGKLEDEDVYSGQFMFLCQVPTN
jgi:hypothetical protein